MARNPHLDRARRQRDTDRRCIGIMRDGLGGDTRQPLGLSDDTATRLVVLAVRILTERCKLTGEDPADVLAEAERMT